MKLVDKPLTDLQRKFARYYVEAKYGTQHLSNSEYAIRAGYSPDSAYELLNPKISPHVVIYIEKLQEDFRIKNNIDPDKHMARLNFLGQEAEKQKMIGVALRAEELRGKVAGYYVDRQIIKNKNDDINEMNSEQLEVKMKELLSDYSHILEPEVEKMQEEENKILKEATNGKTKSKRNG